MLPNDDDLRAVEHRYVELRADAAAYRLATAARPATQRRPSLRDRLSAVLSRLQPTRSARTQAKATA